MGDRLVNREPEMRRVKHEIVAADLHRLSRELLNCLLRPLRCVTDEILLEHILPSSAGRSDDVSAVLEI